MLGTSEDVIFNTRNRFPRNYNHNKKDCDLLLIVFCSVIDQHSWNEDPETSHFLLFSQFLQLLRKIIFFFQSLQIISKYKAHLSNGLFCLVLVDEGFGFQCGRKMLPTISICQFLGLTLITKQKMDKRFGTLFNSDLDLLPTHQKANLIATQTIIRKSCKSGKTPYPNLWKIFDGQPLNLYQSLRAQTPVSWLQFFPRSSHSYFFNHPQQNLQHKYCYARPLIHHNLKLVNLNLEFLEKSMKMFVVQNNHLTVSHNRPIPSATTSLSTQITQPMLFFFIKTSRAHSHDFLFLTLDYTINKNNIFLCCCLISYLYATYFSDASLSTTCSFMYLQYSN